ncbi:MAG: hypothetical protein IJ257_02105 [Treponema sp.]|nr:hypothetical protein [Treponema sp.]
MKFVNIIAAFIAFSTVSISAAADFSTEENTFIQNLLDFRLSLRSYKTNDEALEKVRAYKDEHLEEILSFGEEASLVCLNMLATSEYNIFYAKDMHAPEMEEILRPQYEKIIEFQEKHPVSEQNPWFTLTSADIINSMMQFLKQSLAIKLGLQEKKDYASVVERFPDMSFALMLSGFWYYYAPGIGGGSKSKARDFFEKSLKYASNDYERFYGNINYSQSLFEYKKKDEAAQYLEEAEKILPDTNYIAFIRKINSLGYSLFDYNMNSTREKLDKKLAEFE